MNKEKMIEAFLELTDEQKKLWEEAYETCPSGYKIGEENCCECGCIQCWLYSLEEESKNMDKLSKYTKVIANLEEVVEHEYNINLSALNKGRESVEEAIKESQEEGFESTYFSTKIEFDKMTKEVKEHALAGGCVRMIVFKKWIKETFGIEDVELDVVKLDNYTTYVRAIINHGLEK